jgi:putative transcriptional regulator
VEVKIIGLDYSLAFATVLTLEKGRLLIAEPSIIGDVSFNRSVILLAEYAKTGSVGFILTKPLWTTSP